ncbi:hypothetical protein L1887_31663 [Cichorium endivia]|nr:hypothetical protein L1887_31663 [Cichorium endivia]
MAQRSNNFVCFTCFIFLPSIILILINHCDGSPSLWDQYANQCNGTIGECPMLVEENEEFLMDTEELARIVAKKRVLQSQDRNNPACDKKCQGAYNAGNRPCTNGNYCSRG